MEGNGGWMGVIFLRARNPANARVAHRGLEFSRPTPREVIEKNYRIPDGGCRPAFQSRTIWR